MLVGRNAERRRLDALLRSAREDRSAVLVIRGDPGIGKTALLEYAAEQAEDMNVLRCVGIEAEHEMPFAGMHQLVRSSLELLDRLPAPQAAALRGALGLSADAVADRFLVSLALLSLLAETCEERPTLCCVDDAQWLDAPSAEALLFAARRFEAEPIAVLLGVREGELRRFDAPGLPVLELGALDPGTLGRCSLPDSGRERPRRCSRCCSPPRPGTRWPFWSCRRRSPRDSSRAANRSSARRRFARPWRRHSATRVAELSETTERVLLIAAADEAGDLAAIGRAAERLGIDAAAELDVAERARARAT